MPQHGRNRPRRGSMQFWPRVRAKRIYPRIKNWPKIDQIIPVAFAGYKVGMTHAIVIENRKNSHLYGQNIQIPLTIIEVPPLKVLGLRIYKKTSDGLKSLTEIIHPEFDGKVLRKIKTLKPTEKQDIEKELLEKSSLVKLIVHTQPWLAGIGKKTPEIFEIPIGGNNVISQYNYAKSLLGKEIKIVDVFKEGEQIDVISVTKGKGFEGTVKRFGVKILPRPHKTDKKARAVQSKGAWGMRRIFPTTPMPGQMGYHRRTEYNKQIIKISDSPSEINPPSGWIRYGLIKSSWIAIKGSIPGPRKRLIILRKAIRPNPKIPNEAPKILYISTSPEN
ncbi:MAG: 50S ribosomal protein L3 [Candidatus Aenigmatarchaeota archaeon]